ncbi:MAG: metallophosphoesterase [Oscillospiraceae bacterium]|jgi:predicted MPP superfamily phosphohydrolase|nr:metallophosphoesterase [Oscillospiraceae bacterium]
MLRGKRRRGCGFGCFTLIFCVVIAFCFYDSNTTLDTETYDLHFAGLPRDFDGYRIAVVSDVHAKEFGADNARLIAAVANAAPDMIAVTGDLIDGPDQLGIVLPLVHALSELAPVYFITGNHEWDSGSVRELLAALPENGAVVLRNQVVTLRRGDASIALVGLEDPNGPADMRKPFQVFEDVPQDAFTVTLVHRNTYLPTLAELGADLVLCGHAHGGIVRLPFTDGLIDQTGFLPTYTNGAYTMGGTTMLVSRGLGNVYNIPRLFNRPHIPVAVLHTA